MRAAFSTLMFLVAVGCNPLPPADDVDTDTDSDVDTDTDTDTDGDSDVDTDALDDFDYLAPPVMVTFEPGSVTLGSAEDDPGHTPTEAQRDVQITYRFQLAETEVMQGQFEAWLSQSPSYWGGCRRCAVESVDWDAAAFYANTLSEAEDLTACYSCEPRNGGPVCSEAVEPATCDGYRLPTEAEWEYAARGGARSDAFPVGGDLASPDDLRSCEGPVELSDSSELGAQAWYCANSDGTPGSTTRPAGQLRATREGVHDLAGNVFEWTHDGWLEDPTSETTLVDPYTVPPNAEGASRVIRGGAWNSSPKELRVSFRTLASRSRRTDNLGFRLARTLPTP